ncbi:MAG: NAD(P)-dependent oxidoreductase [Brumimicrobium sp.]
MKILVTGGAGYVGSSLVDELEKREDVETIYVLDNLSNASYAFFFGAKPYKKVQFVKGDILDTYTVEQLIDKVDVVFHLAGFVISPYNYTQNVQYEQINQWGTLNLVRCVQQSKNKIKRFVYLSSVSVLGLHGEVSLEDVPQPTNAYATSKFEGEKYVLLLENHCETHIIRSGNVFGFNTSVRLDSVMNTFIFHALTDKKLLIYGDGTQQRPFVSIEACTKILLDCIDDKKNGKQVKYALQFNADLNQIKDWLIDEQVPDLEFTYINRNISYKGQEIVGIKSLEENIPELNEVFDFFKSNIRISAQ